jgi:hypothetical protein
LLLKYLLQSAALGRTVLPAVSMDSNLKLRIASPTKARADVLAGRSDSNSASLSEETRGFQNSKALVVSRHFVGISLGLTTVNASDVLLLDPSPLEHQESRQLLEGLVFIAVDLEGNICLVETSSGNDSSDRIGGASIPADKLLHLCEAASRHAQAQIVPILRPLVSIL